MIIRLTVNDNDFYYLIMDFMKNMWRHSFCSKEIDDMTLEEKIAEVENIIKHEDLIQLINPNYDKKLNEEEQSRIISYLKEKFEKYINTLEKDEHAKKYLIESLEIKIQKSFVDRWENGEAFYWLQHSNKIINQ